VARTGPPRGLDRPPVARTGRLPWPGPPAGAAACPGRPGCR